MRRSVIAALAVSALLVTGARADDISDALNEAKAAYDGGDISGTKRALEIASQLVAQKQAEGLSKLLPAAPAGWTAENTDNNASITAVFGGGVTAERRYARDGKTIQLTLMANSPLLGSMAAMFTNPQILGGMGKVFRVKGRIGVMTDDNEIQLALGKTFVTISGTAAEADKRALLDLVDVAAVEAYVK